MLKIVLAFSLFLSACASKKLAHQAEKMDSTSPHRVAVSAEVVREYSDAHNLLIQINFESQDGNWVRVDQVELDLSNPDNEPYNIIVGRDLVAWAESKAEEKKIKEFNDQSNMAGAMLAGGALALWGVFSNRSEWAGAGTVLASAAGSYGIYQGIQKTAAKAQGVTPVPETHLYSPFAIPSMSLVKKWILVNVPTGRVAKTATLKMKTVEGETLNYRVRLTK